MSQQEFPLFESWDALDALVRDQEPDIDVQAISDNDFNDEGMIILNPPSVRTSFAGAVYTSTSDSQRLSYDVVGRFVLLCGEEDHSAERIRQARASLALAHRVARLVAGARIRLRTGEISEPITLTAMEPIPVVGLGTAYGIAIEVPGLAQFAGINAQPHQGGAQ